MKMSTILDLSLLILIKDLRELPRVFRSIISKTLVEKSLLQCVLHVFFVHIFNLIY